MKRSCLDRVEIELALRGQLAPDDFDSAVSHLDDCERCRSVAESVQQDGHWLVDSLAGDADPLQLETACQVALWQVMETPVFTGMVDAAVGTVPQEMLGPYRLIRSLGSGGMAAVYLAEHVRLRRRCAIKILPRDRVDQPGWLERFDREMTTVASLEHPHVVRATDAGHQDGWHYLVMEYLDGLDVGRIAMRIGPLDVADACEIVRQAALGLAHIHTSGLVHRDVKPSNMMLTREGKLKLLDLGLVLSGDDPLSVDDRLTTVGHLMGTMPYMAPEQLIDSREVDARADIYALGATLYRLIAGKPPHHRHGGLAKQVMAITNQDAPPLDSVRDALDDELVSLVSSMTSRDPAQRPQTAEEVANRLSELGNGGQLKRLLRQSLRRTSSEMPAASSFAARVQPTDDDTNRRVWPSWIAATAIAATLLLAGFVLKIATDRGELVIRSAVDGIVVSISQGDEVVERLQIKAGPDNHVTLHKGTYQIDIEGGSGELALSKNVVTIGRGTEAAVDLKPESTMRLYQGKDLAQWMSLLEREEDPNTLGQIMAAVEVLTRETDGRTKAAKVTLRTARIWGGFSSSIPGPRPSGMVSDSPSQHYMHHLMKVFPRYGADGLEAVDNELMHGNTRSRQAAIWILSDLVDDSGPMPPNLVEHLEKAVREILEDDVLHAVNSADLAKRLAVQLLVKQDRPIAAEEWLEDHVRSRISAAVDKWTSRHQPTNAFGNARNSWVLDEYELAAALELETQGRLEIDWKWLASVLVHERYRRVSDRTDAVFDAVAESAPDKLLDSIESKLLEMTTPVVDDGAFGFRTESTDRFWNGLQWIPAFELGSPDSVWSRGLAFLADHANTAETAPSDDAFLPTEFVAPDAESLIERLGTLRKLMIRHGADPKHPSKPFQWIDAAIEQLEKKAETKSTAP